MYKGIFVDAIPSDKRFADLMSSKGRHGLQIECQKPGELVTLAQYLWASQPDLVALDYRLNDSRKKRALAYKATPLARRLE